MDLWTSYQKMAFGDFDTKRLLLSTGERHHTSLNMIKDRAIELEAGELRAVDYSKHARYIIAKNLTYDLLVTIYNVNTSAVVVARFTKVPRKKDWDALIRHVRMWKSPNIEIRAIGLQNLPLDNFSIIETLRKNVKGKFIELDLFGSDVRHLALDLKTGVPYDLLLLNKLYRPGELASQVKKEDYQKTVSELVYK